MDVKRKLFKVLSSRLSRVRPLGDSAVLCPLCLERRFTADQIACSELTVEHIVPSELGGRLLTLTCRQCNNSQGSALDKHVVGMVKARNAVEGIGSLPARILTSVGTVETNVAWTSGRPDDPRTFHVVPKATNPACVNALRQELGPEYEMKVTLNFGFIRGAAYKGLYRIAYLGLFNELGYEYVFSPGATQVRSVVTSDTYDGLFPVLEVETAGTLPKPVFALHPTGSAAPYLVFMRLKSVVDRHYAVLLPSTGSTEDREKLGPVAQTLRTGSLMITFRGEAMPLRLRREYFSASTQSEHDV